MQISSNAFIALNLRYFYTGSLLRCAVCSAFSWTIMPVITNNKWIITENLFEHNSNLNFHSLRIRVAHCAVRRYFKWIWTSLVRKWVATDELSGYGKWVKAREWKLEWKSLRQHWSGWKNRWFFSLWSTVVQIRRKIFCSVTYKYELQ